MQKRKALGLSALLAVSIALVTQIEGQNKAPKFDLETPVVALQEGAPPAPDLLLVAVPLKNVGSAAATNVVVRQVIMGPGLRQIPATLPLSLGDIPAGEDVILNLGFSNVPPNGRPPVIVEGSFTYNGRTQSFQANVVAPPPSPNAGEKDGARADIAPETTNGGDSFPPAPPHTAEDANDEEHDFPVPQGRLIGDLMPPNDSVELPDTRTPSGPRLRAFAINDPVSFFRLGTQAVQNNPGSFFPWDPSGASADYHITDAALNKVVFLTGNTYALLSTNGGTSFTKLDPTTFFNTNFDGGLCCDQVVQYIPQINRFVWLMQFWPVQLSDSNGKPLFDGNGKAIKGKNRIRIATASPSQVASSGGKLWTYWDLTSYGTFNAGNAWMDYPDMSYTNDYLHVSIDMQGSGLFVIRAPLSEIQAGTTLHLRYTDPANGSVAFGSHLTQDSTDAAYWFGQVSTSSLRIFEWPDNSNSYSWRTLNVNSWNNSSYQTLAPNNVDWLSFGFARAQVRGATVEYPSLGYSRIVKIAWSAARGGGFPQPYVRLLDVLKTTLPGSSPVWSVANDKAIWNANFAFQHPYMSTNSNHEVGINLAYGGPNDYPTPLVGFVGDKIMHFANKSTTAIGRWGDYSAIRKHPNNPALFSTSDYFLQKGTAETPAKVVHQYRLWGRTADNGTN
jgi:hypothetical protein